MQIAFRTDIGRVSTKNQDAILVDQEKGIFLLADGMGGHNAGEIASSLAVNTAYEYLKDKIGYLDEDKDILEAIHTAVLKSHETVKAKGASEMGTTLVTMIIKGKKSYICHAGDSRAYLFRDRLQQMTKDHTFAEYSMEHESMKREEVPDQFWNIVTQSVGIDDDLSPDSTTVELKDNDILMLCSDGLNKMLTDNDIFPILNKRKMDLDEAATSLIAEANDKGGKDNISVILVGL